MKYERYNNLMPLKGDVICSSVALIHGVGLILLEKALAGTLLAYIGASLLFVQAAVWVIAEKTNILDRPALVSLLLAIAVAAAWPVSAPAILVARRRDKKIHRANIRAKEQA